MEGKELTVVNFEEYAMTPDKVVRQINLIQEVMQKVMKLGEHYGTIPGCGPKPTLLKPGAEKISTTFRLAPEYKITKTDLKDGHREYEIVCSLVHIPTGQFVGQGVGACTTMEGKYRFRSQGIPTGEPIPKDYKAKKGWYKAQGFTCKKDDESGEWQWCKLEKGEHDNPADYYNTVLKMAKKRAHVDAVLTATAASDIFTQDIEDMPEVIPQKTEAMKPEAPQEAQPSEPEKPKAKPLNKAQGEKIIAIAANHERSFSADEAKEIIDWYCQNNEHGGRTFDAGQALIFGFESILNRFLASREQAQEGI